MTPVLPARVVMASGNAGKIREIARLLDGLQIEVIAQSQLGVADALETGSTFAENSLLKAQHACQQTGLPAIADDSGLAVDALDGAPGVYSARYAGSSASDDDNINKLLRELRGSDSRHAAFHCVATMVFPDSDQVLRASGVWRGHILQARRGDSGFGYDPVFFDATADKSAAELTPDEKNARSHRGQALRGLVSQLERRFS